jgi:hypothetical protein
MYNWIQTYQIINSMFYVHAFDVTMFDVCLMPW